MHFEVKFNLRSQHIKVSFNRERMDIPVQFDGLQTVTKTVEHDAYAGLVEVTPTREEQTLPTNGKLLASDIIIKPIPKEYGLVTYDNRKVITIT